MACDVNNMPMSGGLGMLFCFGLEPQTSALTSASTAAFTAGTPSKTVSRRLVACGRPFAVAFLPKGAPRPTSFLAGEEKVAEEVDQGAAGGEDYVAEEAMPTPAPPVVVSPAPVNARPLRTF